MTTTNIPAGAAPKARRTPRCHYEERQKPLCSQRNGTKTAYAQTLYTTDVGAVTCKRCLKTKFVKFALAAQALRKEHEAALGGTPIRMGVFQPATPADKVVVSALKEAAAADLGPDAVLEPLLKAGTVRWLTGTDGVRTHFYEDDEPLPDEILAKPTAPSLADRLLPAFSAFADPAKLLDTTTEEGARIAHHIEWGPGTCVESKAKPATVYERLKAIGTPAPFPVIEPGSLVYELLQDEFESNGGAQ